jgi:hypothetical protein
LGSYTNWCTNEPSGDGDCVSCPLAGCGANKWNDIPCTPTTRTYLCEKFPNPTAFPTKLPTVCPTFLPSSTPTRNPTSQPTRHPSSQPTKQPSSQPTKQPFSTPSSDPSRQPSSKPSCQPSNQPSSAPSGKPSTAPSDIPSSQPTNCPSIQPTCNPSVQPSDQPTAQPSTYPTLQPSTEPSSPPTIQPTSLPSNHPTQEPTNQPTSQPSDNPTSRPSIQPNSSPTSQPSKKPSTQPISEPSSLPSVVPSRNPSSQPSNNPSTQPASAPSSSPSSVPSKYPSSLPSRHPSSQPSSIPSPQPSTLPTSQPSKYPSSFPSDVPSAQPSTAPTSQPSRCPSSCPSNSPSSYPSSQPSIRPSSQPSDFPSAQPSTAPTSQPSRCPSSCPSNSPSSYPSSQPSICPSSQPSDFPSAQPSPVPTSQPSPAPSSAPSSCPSYQPSDMPSSQPSNVPSSQPSDFPSAQPSSAPSSQPSKYPSSAPSSCPSYQPSDMPSSQPSDVPSSQPSNYPSSGPSNFPSARPSTKPSHRPSSRPSCNPSAHPSVRPSSCPSLLPSNCPSSQPSNLPSSQPTITPTLLPSSPPTSNPSSYPSMQSTSKPSLQPTSQPSRSPSSQPSAQPSNLPSSLPSVLPTKTPSLHPTVLPTDYPSSQPSAQPTNNPASLPTNRPSHLQVVKLNRLYLKGSFLLMGSWLPSYVNEARSFDLDSRNYLNDANSYIIFGRKSRFPVSMHLGSGEKFGFYTELNYLQGGIRRDIISRTLNLIGDINNDGYLDLIEGFSLNSICLVYLGDKQGFTNMKVSFRIFGVFNSDGIGWAVSGLGDINNDEVDDFIISARNSGICYVIFGQRTFTSGNDIYLDSFNELNGYRIRGLSSSSNNVDVLNGLSVANAGDFNNDGMNDILINVFSIRTSKSYIYIVFSKSQQNHDIYLDQLGTSGFTIVSEPFQYAGMSLTGIGDINSDGNDDILIGTIPMVNGRFLEKQQSYVIYGQSYSQRNTSQLLLSKITESDGFIINGGGFLVANPGDVNEDGINDFLVVNYNKWIGQGNAYLMVYRLENVTTPPTYQPSFSPTSSPTNHPTSFPSNKPTALSFFIPTIRNLTSDGPMTVVPLALPTLPPTNFPSKKPTSQPIFPTFNPTRTKPSVRPSQLPMISPTLLPIQLPTDQPSNNTEIHPSTNFAITECNKSGDYYGVDGQNEHFLIQSEGTVNIYCRSNLVLEQDVEIKVFKIISKIGIITIYDFNVMNDIFDLSFFPQFKSINNIPYSSPPIQLTLSESLIIIIIPSTSDVTLAETNFIFHKESSSDHPNSQKMQLDLIIVGAVLIFVTIVSASMIYCTQDFKKKGKVGFPLVNNQQTRTFLDHHFSLSSSLSSWFEDSEEDSFLFDKGASDNDQEEEKEEDNDDFEEQNDPIYSLSTNQLEETDDEYQYDGIIYPTSLVSPSFLFTIDNIITSFLSEYENEESERSYRSQVTPISDIDIENKNEFEDIS